MKLSIIIPAYNEEKTIAKLISIVKKVDLKKQGFEKEIIVVNDGSKDNTAKIVKKIKGVKLINQKNMGKGGAVRTGFNAATGDILLVQDADLEYNPYEYKELLKPFLEQNADVVYGSRFLSEVQKKKNVFFLKKHKKAYNIYFLGGRVVTLCANILYFSSLTDEATCYKVFRKKVLSEINLVGNGFEWEPEITAKVLKKKYKIYEVPISYNPRTFEEGKKINWKDGVKAIWTLVKYRFVN